MNLIKNLDKENIEYNKIKEDNKEKGESSFKIEINKQNKNEEKYEIEISYNENENTENKNNIINNHHIKYSRYNISKKSKFYVKKKFFPKINLI